ncbi:MAG: hypothetical protein OXR68_00845 [Alphaproteobacteria bacterium]|nr:hypothetical protein [Alphaproteobacteria bacterium]
MPFSQMPVLEAYEPPLLNKSDIFLLVKYLIVFIGLLLVVFMIIRPAMNAFSKAVSTMSSTPSSSASSLPPAAGGAMPMPNAPVADGSTEQAPNETVAINQVEGRVRESMVKQVTEVIDQHPEESLSVVRGWMADAN